MPHINEDDVQFTENTMVQVYSALLDSGIYGEKATEVVAALEKRGILFREKKPKRRGRPPKPAADIREATPEEKAEIDAAWQPGDPG